MALSNALPNPGEWFRQWTREPGESALQDASSKLLTLGSIAMTVVAVASVMIFVGLGTTLAEQILNVTVDLGFLGLGQAKILPGLALAGGIIAVAYTLQIESIAGDREILRDDANWIIGVSAALYILAAVNVSVPFVATTSFAFVALGLGLVSLYVWRVIMGRE